MPGPRPIPGKSSSISRKPKPFITVLGDDFVELQIGPLQATVTSYTPPPRPFSEPIEIGLGITVFPPKVPVQQTPQDFIVHPPPIDPSIDEERKRLDVFIHNANLEILAAKNDAQRLKAQQAALDAVDSRFPTRKPTPFGQPFPPPEPKYDQFEPGIISTQTDFVPPIGAFVKAIKLVPVVLAPAKSTEQPATIITQVPQVQGPYASGLPIPFSPATAQVVVTPVPGPIPQPATQVNPITQIAPRPPAAGNNPPPFHR